MIELLLVISLAAFAGWLFCSFLIRRNENKPNPCSLCSCKERETRNVMSIFAVVTLTLTVVIILMKRYCS